MSAEAGPSKPLKVKKKSQTATAPADGSSQPSAFLEKPKKKKRKDPNAVTNGGADPASTLNSIPVENGKRTSRKATKRKEDELDSPFRTVRSSIRLSIPPLFAMDLQAGAEELLDSLIMRYSPPLEAVLLSYSNIHFNDSTGADIVNDCPFTICDVQFDAVVWAPRVGMRLAGIHSISTASHISLILYKTFNVTIPLPQIPLDHYEFDENAREGLARTSGGEGMELTEEEEEEREEVGGEGRWRMRVAEGEDQGELVGAGGEDVVFTVNGLHVSNQMLSLTGSLLSHPSKRSATTSLNPNPDPEQPAPGTQTARERAIVPSALLQNGGMANTIPFSIGEGLVAPPNATSSSVLSRQKHKKSNPAIQNDIATAKTANRNPGVINSMTPGGGEEERQDPFQAMEQANKERKEADLKKAKAEKKAAKKAAAAAAAASAVSTTDAAQAAAPSANPNGVTSGDRVDEEMMDEKTDVLVGAVDKVKKKKKRAVEDGEADREGGKKKRRKE